MELYDPKNTEADIQRIKDDLEPYWKRQHEAGHVINYEIRAGYQNMNLFWAAVDYVADERFGTITAHYVVLILDGEIKYQSAM